MSNPAGGAGAILSRFEQTTGRPLRAMIEISDRCNEVCVHCYQVQGQKGEMSTAQLKGVLDELAELGVLVLTISGGEATLRRDFLEILAHAHTCGFAIRLFTNGLTMTEELARQLKSLAVQSVEISLYSHRADVHDFVTGVPGSFERTVAGIRFLVAEGVDTHIKAPSLSVNAADIDAYIAFADSLRVTYAIDPEQLMPREGGDRTPEAFSRSLDERARLIQHPRLAAEEPRSLPPRAPTDTLCGAGESLHIEPNGELRPCTMLEVPLGNAAQGLRRARDESPTRGRLVALRWRDAHGCRECDLSGYCFRCHASALAEVGDALAPYPSACANACNSYEIAHRATLRITAEPPRDPALGPYRQRAPHEFEAIEDRIDEADDALAQKLVWARRAGAQPAPAPVRRGELVQIRRPGQSKARWTQVPGNVGPRADDEQQTITVSSMNAAETVT